MTNGQASTQRPSPSRPPLRASADIRLVDRFGRAFPGPAMLKGLTYVRDKRVDVAESTEQMLDANVRGKRMQHVSLQLEAGTLAAACTCGAVSMGPPSCPHVFAALLECDRRGLFAALRTSRAPLELHPLAAKTRPAEEEETTSVEEPKKKPKAAKSEKGKEKENETKKDVKGASPSARSPRATAPPPEPRGTRRRPPRRS